MTQELAGLKKLIEDNIQDGEWRNKFIIHLDMVSNIHNNGEVEKNVISRFGLTDTELYAFFTMTGRCSHFIEEYTMGVKPLDNPFIAACIQAFDSLLIKMPKPSASIVSIN